MEENFGGITLAHVIQFQTRILFGAQYGRIELANKNRRDEQLIIACLRMGWNDAFRHVSTNQPSANEDVKNYLKNSNQRYEDYYCSILDNKDFLAIFKKYASAKSTDDKCKAIQENWWKIKDVLKIVKVTEKAKENDKPLCFGHIQKMFNIAVKLYLCVYMCREHLGLDDLPFDQNMLDALPYADCPIDSIILGETNKKQYRDLVWSKIHSPEEITTYKNIQDDFREESKRDGGNSSLYFDFVNWN